MEDVWNNSSIFCKPINMAPYKKSKIADGKTSSILNEVQPEMSDELTVDEQIELFADIIIDYFLKDINENPKDEYESKGV
jgi:hypothetical protein